MVNNSNTPLDRFSSNVFYVLQLIPGILGIKATVMNENSQLASIALTI